MALIDRFMPKYRRREVERAFVVASPEAAWQAVRYVDSYRVAFVRALFSVRTAPMRLVRWFRRLPPTRAPTGRLDDFTAEGTGFVRLAEDPGREVVIGSIGRFWRPNILFAQIDPDGFLAFGAPGFGKIAYNLKVEAREGGGSWISMDLRVNATDERAWKKFERYWRLIGPFSRLIRRAALRLAHREIGPPPVVTSGRLPGDEILGAARFQKTHARFIEAPPSDVWPWLLQMGGDRAGWYSFDRLDNRGVPSAGGIVPGLQQLELGQLIPAMRDSPEAFAVLRLEPERVLVLGSPSLRPGFRRRPEEASQVTWSFVLEPVGEGATRLVVRARAEYEPSLQRALLRPLVRIAHEIMQRAQLRHLGERAALPALMEASRP